MNPVIDILMTTYNGARYISNQLYSLIQQTEVNWRLFVRDDGSKDDTVSILRKFAAVDSRFILVEDNLGNLGAAKSFLMLTKYAKSDYVIFCDQDDIWFEKKLEFLLKEANVRLKPSSPGFVYCDGYGYSDELGIITLPNISKVHASKLNEFIFLNAGYQGCSIFFNQALCGLLQEYRGRDLYMHDDIVSLMGHTFGDVFFLDKALMLYRQHSDNVTGNIKKFCFYDFFLRVVTLRSFVISNKHYLEKKEFYCLYKDRMNEYQKSLFEAYLSFPTVGLCSRLYLLARYGFKEGQSRLSLWVKTILRSPMQ